MNVLHSTTGANLRCPHCAAHPAGCEAIERPIEAGRAYAWTCSFCGLIVALRAAGPGDPPAPPIGLSDREVAGLRFVRWLLHDECDLQVCA